MTLRQLAQDVCCNCQSGTCLGAGWRIAENDSVVPMRLATAGKPCVVAAGTRCGFFEMVPPADMKEAYYALLSTGDAVRPRLGRCGHVVDKGKRFCLDCARNRQRESSRNSKRRIRGLGVHKTAL